MDYWMNQNGMSWHRKAMHDIMYHILPYHMTTVHILSLQYTSKHNFSAIHKWHIWPIRVTYPDDLCFALAWWHSTWLLEGSKWHAQNCMSSPIARFMGPTRGPSGADRTQVGPMLAPWALLSGMAWYGMKWLVLVHFNENNNRTV